MSSPKKRIVPDDGGKSPVTQLNSVVLPAPLEPSTARRSPGRTVIVTSVSAASAPNIRVTPRSSSAAPAPIAEMRRATLSMARSSACARLVAPPPALPEADHAIGRPEHDDEKSDADQKPEAVAVEPELDEEIEREGPQDDENERADERADRPRDAADHGDDQDVDGTLDRNRTRRDLPVVPDLEDAAERRDQGRESIGGDAMRVDIEAQRGHAARIVAHALQGETERRAREIEYREIAERRDRERQVIEGNIGAPVDAPDMRRGDRVDAGMAVEDRPVLIGEVVEGGADGERDHVGVDALGAPREPPAERAEGGRERERHRRRKPPRPAETDIGAAADAEDGVHVAGKASDGELHQADHAAIARQEHQAESDDPEDQRRAEDLDQEEAVGDQRHDHEDGRDGPGGGIVERRPSAGRRGERRAFRGSGRRLGVKRGALGQRHVIASPTSPAAAAPAPAP